MKAITNVIQPKSVECTGLPSLIPTCLGRSYLLGVVLAKRTC